MKLRDWNCETKAFDFNNVRSTTWNNVFLRCWVLSHPEINMNPWKWVDIQCTIVCSMNFCRILAMNSLNRPTQQELVWRSLTLPSSLVIWFSIGRLKNGARRAKHVCPLGGFGAVHSWARNFGHLCSKELCATTAQTILCNTYCIYHNKIPTAFRRHPLQLDSWLHVCVKIFLEAVSEERWQSPFLCSESWDSSWFVGFVEKTVLSSKQTNQAMQIASRELTYPHKMGVWRWFSFSQGGIC